MFPFREPKATKYIETQIEEAQVQRAQTVVALTLAETTLVYRKQDKEYYDTLLKRLYAEKAQLEKELENGNPNRPKSGGYSTASAAGIATSTAASDRAAGNL
jgi:hypothetical protein